MYMQKEHKEKHRECEDSKREMMRIQQELNYNRYILEERDRMIQVRHNLTNSIRADILFCYQEHGLVIVGDDEDSDENTTTTTVSKTPRKVIVSTDVASLLEKAGDGSLGNNVEQSVS